MNRPRNQLLAGAGLAQDQYGWARRSDDFNLLQHGLQTVTFTDDLLEVVLCAQLLLQIAFFLFQLAAELNNPAVAVVDLDCPSDLAGCLAEHLYMALVEGGLAPAAYEKGADHFTSAIPRNPATRLHSGPQLESGRTGVLAFDLAHQEWFLVDENPALRRTFDGKNTLLIGGRPAGRR